MKSAFWEQQMPSPTSSTKSATANGIAVDFGGTKTAAARIVNGVVTDRVQVATIADVPTEQHVDCPA